MTVVNGEALLVAAPIKEMLQNKVREHGVSHGLAEVGYDIRLRQDVKFAPIQRLNGRMGYNVYHDIGNRTEGVGRLALASAIEEFDMPLDLVGILHDKSTWARRGLTVCNTVIEPGWRGFLTLELVYHGQGELIIPAGAGIGQVIFHRLARSASYEGKYQDQPDEIVDAIHG
jgi:dCTP deaminase